MDQLNNREIATLLWGFIIFTVCVVHSLKNEKLRPLLLAVLQSLLNIKIIISILIISVYVITTVYFLNFLNIWDMSQLKNTLVWYFAFVLGTLFQINSIKERSNSFFTESFKSLISLAVFLEFIINFHSFGFYIEFFLVIPIVTFLSILSSVASLEHQKVKTLLNSLLSIIFFIFFINFLINIIKDYNLFINIKSLKDFFIPILLTIFYLPFLWFFLLYIKYEDFFVRLQFSIEDKRIINLAKVLVILNFGNNTKSIEEWFHHIKIHRINNLEELYESIKLIKIRKAKEKHPALVSCDLGWSSHEARFFLQNFKLEVKYKDIGDEIWLGSNSIELDESFNPPSISYYILGNEDAVTQLKIKLFLYDVNQTSKYLNTYIDVIDHLLMNSLAVNLPLGQREVIKSKTSFSIPMKNKKLEFKYEEFLHILPPKCEFSISIENSS